ncbi:hypothetical protein OV203_12535 [Nannocystis sp. ILAH1]|uniref:hypothetical protein n=1 Tax=unclassified Nannocystis TaxID=2627009 RepID=UPI00226E5533|nr:MULTISPECIES: hypothetical protein [unclassified Nannocystis]MCY0987958.1 hypothetical protein [Nannocystis sp. ILAH1]MCY1065699.1 hypothetical protein [Nannocystis sp. RBIL2]
MNALLALVAKTARPVAHTVRAELNEEDVLGRVDDVDLLLGTWDCGEDLALDDELAGEAAADDDVAGTVDGPYLPMSCETRPPRSLESRASP